MAFWLRRPLGLCCLLGCTGVVNGGGTCPQGRCMPPCVGNIVPVDPTMNVQAILDQAQPGDVIQLAPGTYHQSLVVSRSGTASAPISICAAEPGSVVISGATPPTYTLAFSHLGGDLYAAQVPWTVRWVMANGRNLLGYDDLAGLQAFAMLGHDTGVLENGPPEGFAWQSGTLYLRLLAAQDPNDANVEIHREFELANDPALNSEYFGNRAAPSNRDDPLDEPQGTNITITGSHVVVAGLKLHLGPLSAVKIAASDVTIRDSYIDGAWRSIRAGSSPRVNIEYNELTGYPAYQWVRFGALNGDQWGLWNSIYNSNLNINHIHHSGPSFRLAHNRIYEGFDCVWARAMGNLDPANQSEYLHNAISSCGDEVIEFDSRNPLNLRVHHNFFMDATAVLAMSPVQGGGLMVDHNIAYISPEYGLPSSTLLKFDCPWCTNNPGPTQSVTLAHNTLVNSQRALFWTGQDHSYADCTADNNVFFTRRESGWVHSDFTLTPYNLHAAPNVNVNANNMSQCIHAEDPGFASPPTMEPGALIDGVREVLPVVPLQAAPIATDDRPVDFRLTSTSPGIDAGNPAAGLDELYYHLRRGAAPDLGALERGEAWDWLTGPRWTSEARPWRPPLPPSLPPIWVGQ